jgi:hypothetical protein
LTTSGTSATRRSPSAVSFGTPIFMRKNHPTRTGATDIAAEPGGLDAAI